MVATYNMRSLALVLRALAHLANTPLPRLAAAWPARPSLDRADGDCIPGKIVKRGGALTGCAGAHMVSLSPQRKQTMKTDLQLQQDVMSELTWEPAVDAALIGVEVRGAVVTLSGQVASYAQKWAAERAALRVAGLQALAVELSVRLPGDSVRSDADIARTVKDTLAWRSDVPDDKIKITVEGGWITLSGEVDWDYQRKSASAGVRYLMGVTGLSDDIRIKRRVVSASVLSAIEGALTRGAHTDARNIDVHVDGGDVTLSGTVHTWPERELARHAAWGTPGVNTVVDNITLKF